MGHEELIETLLKEGENKCREVMEKARAESEATLLEARERAGQLGQTSREEFQKEIQARRARIFSQARIEGRGILLRAKHEVLDQVFARAEERLRARLKRAGGGDTDRRFWIRRVEESLPKSRPAGIKALLHEAAPDDLEGVLRQRGVACERVTDPELWFGFRLVSTEGEVVVTNSYRSRLEKIRSDLMVDLNTLLFGKHSPHLNPAPH
jgi:vacuolar-type H+-ATPase subunit E/Vma4